MSNFVSTRDAKDIIDSRGAMVRGLSQCGGLYAPVSVPHIEYESLFDLDYSEIAKKIIASWFDDMPYNDVSQSCDEAYLNHFDSVGIAPIRVVDDSCIVELFHGETCAFKDVALSLLPRLLTKAKTSLGLNYKTMILTATSGDTGSAAMNGFKNVDGTGIITFYPHGGVSPLQRRQMVCLDGKNLTACAVKGNFDDCQSAVKEAFSYLPARADLSYSSANSINIARLVPQIVYYYTTYIALTKYGKLKKDEKLSFVVPTGNFGDILAGYYAKKMGLPIGKLICASNANNVLTDFFATGTYDKRRDFIKTSSPSMDILISSNLERLLYHAQNEDTNLVLQQMNELKQNGFYTLNKDILNMLSEDFAAYCFDDNVTKQTIKEFYCDTKHLLDPHTAVAVAAEKRFKRDNPGAKCAVLSTASPFKFVSCISEALGLKEKEDVFETMDMISDYAKIEAPAYLAALRQKTELHTDVIERSQMNSYIQEMCEKLI